MDPTQSFGSTQTQALTVPKTSSERRHDLDWLRVILFGLLIWFHLGVFTFWLFEDGDVPLTVFFVVDVMHQWRLAALFLISGMGTAFAFRRRDLKTFLNERLVRLGVPLLFATYILLGGLIAPVETLWLMLVPFPGADAMPYAHLWFLRNLLLYSVLLAPLFAYVRTNPDAGPVRAARWTVQAGGGLALMTVPALILGASAILTKPWHYGEVGMWWEFPHYFLFTLFGYLAIQTGAMWFERIEALRWWLLVTTLPLSVVWFSIKHEGSWGLMEGGWVMWGKDPFSLMTAGATLLQTLHAWMWCLLVFAWGARLLNRKSRALAWLNEAVYPTYIMHFHITFPWMAFAGIIGMSWWTSTALGTPFVVAGVLVCFVLFRRTAYLRPFVGLRGGREEAEKLWPFTAVDEPGPKLLLHLTAHAVTGMLLLVLMVLAVLTEFVDL